MHCLIMLLQGASIQFLVIEGQQLSAIQAYPDAKSR